MQRWESTKESIIYQKSTPAPELRDASRATANKKSMPTINFLLRLRFRYKYTIIIFPGFHFLGGCNFIIMSSQVDDTSLSAAMGALSTTAATTTVAGEEVDDSSGKIRHPDPQSLPSITTRSYTVNGVATDVWIQLFADRTVVACSQLAGGRIGSWLLCKRTVVDPFSQKVETDVAHLLGSAQRDDPLLQVYAKQVTEQIAKASAGISDEPTTTILLGLSLDPKSSKDPAVFRTIVQLLGAVYQEAIVAAGR